MDNGFEILIDCITTPFGFVAVISALMLMLVNGWTDAPVNIATAIHSGAVKPQTAIFLSAVCNFFGALVMCFFGSSVAVSIYSISGLDGTGEFALSALSSAVAAVVIWALIALKFGLPTSESHALMSALSGAAVAVGGFDTLNLTEWLKALLGIVLSIVPVIISAYFAAIVLKKTTVLPKSSLKKMQVFGAALSSFSHGAQDGQKLAGVLTLAATLGAGGSDPSVRIPVWTVAVSATVISLGTLLGSKKIIKTFKEFAPKDPAAGFASDLVSAVGLLVLSVFGLPASTTHAKSSAVFGAGLCDRRSGSQFQPFKQMVAVWVLTFPASAIMGFFFTECLTALS